MATPQLPLDEQGLKGLVWEHDPYGLQEYAGSLLPENPDNADIYEALELWKVPEEACPPTDKFKGPLAGCPLNYTLETPWKGRRIHVHLRRQVFVSRPSPIWPGNDLFQPHPAFGKSYFSFFGSYEYEIGPVVNCMGIASRCDLCDSGHRGYNHVSAVLAWGEAKIMSGKAPKQFVLQWSNQFKLDMVSSSQPYPPILAEFISHCWPDIWREATTSGLEYDALLELPMLCTQWNLKDLEFDALHTMELGVAAISNASQCSEVGLPSCSEGCSSSMAWTSSLPHVAASLDAIQAEPDQGPSADQGPPGQKPLPDQEPSPEPEQLPDLEGLYEADWNRPPALIPEFDDICHDVLESVDTGEDQHSESSAETVGTYQDPELIGPESEWIVPGW